MRKWRLIFANTINYGPFATYRGPHTEKYISNTILDRYAYILSGIKLPYFKLK